MIHRYSVLFIVIWVLGGCSTQPKVTYKYSNPNISSENKETQWLIDRGECLQESHKIPLPISTPCLGSSAYAQGACEGRQRRLLSEEKEVRQQVFDGCVAKKGYKIEVIEIKE